jgi:tetratricopeptide (TPR) repeat protein
MSPTAIEAATIVKDALESGNVDAVKKGLVHLQAVASCTDDIAGSVGISYMLIGEYEQARKHLETAPESASSLAALAGVRYFLKDYSGSLDAGQKSLKIEPSNDKLRECLALSAENLYGKPYRKQASSNIENEQPFAQALRNGELGKGFKLYQKQYDNFQNLAGSAYMSVFGRQIPRWDGSKVNHLMLVSGQGCGDAVQFIRWASIVAKQVNKLTVVTHPDLVDLFKRSGINAVSKSEEVMTLATADAQHELTLLPCAMESLGYAPASDYLKALPSLPKSDCYRIGICWSASKDDRSAPLETLEPLRQLHGVEFHSLTFHETAPQWMQPCTVKDFAQSADLMASMDLIISVDTVTAHLAGAIGKPVWIALMEPTEWRWESGNTSPWYSTARLFRGDWTGIFKRMAERLGVRGDRSLESTDGRNLTLSHLDNKTVF